VIPAADEADPYAVLGVGRSATQAEIKTAYHALIGRYHPDRHQGNPLADLATERVVAINRAYALLSDPGRRATFDAGTGVPPTASVPPGGPRSLKLVVLAAVLMVALPLVLRVAVRTLRGLGAALGGGGIAALVAAVAVLVALVALRAKRRQ
jgi:preprotein translocase subunit Sec63